LIIGLFGGLFARQRLFLIQKSLTVSDRNLVIIGVYFRERQESVAVSAVIYKGGLKRRFDPGDLRQIDIAS